MAISYSSKNKTYLTAELSKAVKMKDSYLKKSNGNKNNDYVRGFDQEISAIKKRLKELDGDSYSKETY